MVLHVLLHTTKNNFCLSYSAHSLCFNAVSWATGMASSLQKFSIPQFSKDTSGKHGLTQSNA